MLRPLLFPPLRRMSSSSSPPSASSSPTSLSYEERLLLRQTQQRMRDRVLRVAHPPSQVRLALIVHTATGSEGVRRHALSRTTGRLLVRSLASAALLASSLKGEERVSLSLHGDGPVTLVHAEATRTGEARGYVQGGTYELPSGVPLGMALGGGTLEVAEVLYGQTSPYRSLVQLARGDVVSDMEEYFTRVEQLPSFLHLSDTWDEGGLTWSGGLLVQALPPLKTSTPSASTPLELMDSAVARVRDRAKGLPPLEAQLERGLALEEVAAQLLGLPSLPPGTSESHQCAWHCRCSRKEVLSHLALLPEADLAHLELEPAPLKCQYCARDFHVTAQDYHSLRTAKTKRHSPQS